MQRISIYIPAVVKIACGFWLVLMLVLVPPGLNAQSRWIYTIYHHNLPTTKLAFTVGDTLAIDGKNYFELGISAKNLNFSNILFRVENQYRVLIHTQTCLPLQIEKRIDQKNLQDHTQISYNQETHVARKDSLFSWPIPEACHNYFSMLFFFRNQPLNPHDCYSFNLDVEFIIWRVTARVAGIETMSDTHPAIRVDLVYEPISGQSGRPWKTDILTNRIAQKGGSMSLWFQADSSRRISRVDYDPTTFMRLNHGE